MKAIFKVHFYFDPSADDDLYYAGLDGPLKEAFLNKKDAILYMQDVLDGKVSLGVDYRPVSAEVIKERILKTYTPSSNPAVPLPGKESIPIKHTIIDFENFLDNLIDRT